MNRKLHNTVTALAATTGLLVLGLMAANPTMPSPIPAPVEFATVGVAAAQPAPAELAVRARHAAAAAKHIEARAARLEARLAEAKAPQEALGDIVAFAAEAATIAAIATALDEAGTTSTTLPAPAAAAPRKHAPRRQSVAMPYFSFAPRG